MVRVVEAASLTGLLHLKTILFAAAMFSSRSQESGGRRQEPLFCVLKLDFLC
jgi:hypothetical protein